MIEREPVRPTDAELEILGVLWRRGPSTVRKVHDELVRSRPIGYTTVLKLLQIMIEKRLVDRDKSQRSHIYRARDTEQQTQGRLVDDLIQKAFDGSAAKLVLRALAEKPASPEEIAEMRRLLNKLGGGKS